MPIRNIVEGQVVIQCCQVLAVLIWFPGCITKGPLYIESHPLSLPGVSHYGIDIPFFVFRGSVIIIVFCLVSWEQYFIIFQVWSQSIGMELIVDMTRFHLAW